MDLLSLEWWLDLAKGLLPTLIAVGGTIGIAVSQRKRNAEADRVAQKNADAGAQSARAAERSSGAADAAARTAAKVGEQLNAFRLHDDTMRTLYWAADHAIATDSGRALLGLEVLGALVTQAENDRDDRDGVVRKARAAALKVAIPTFISVLTNATSVEDGSGGTIRVTAVEVNAARLLLSHAPSLSTDIRHELGLVSEARLGAEVRIDFLTLVNHRSSGSEIKHERTSGRTRQQDLGFSR